VNKIAFLMKNAEKHKKACFQAKSRFWHVNVKNEFLQQNE
jgi:hypothetical protein